MTERVRDDGYDDLLDAIEVGDGYYLQCEDGHGSFPPRQVCPKCGDRDLTEVPLPETGTVLAHTTIYVATPRFVDDAPYVTAVAAFDDVNLTGQVVGVEPDEVENGMTVSVHLGETKTSGDRLLTFEPR